MTIGKYAYSDDFFVGDIQDSCIIGLDLLECWGGRCGCSKGKSVCGFWCGETGGTGTDIAVDSAFCMGSKQKERNNIRW